MSVYVTREEQSYSTVALVMRQRVALSLHVQQVVVEHVLLLLIS